jgi:histidinol-phosphate/aromatic aminotransferase/cobyric acid decarboxylase-like protein
MVEVRALRRFAKQHPAVQFIVDESFIEFVPGAESIADALPSNAVMLRSMTKFYAIPGLRLGFVVAHSATAVALRRQLMPWSVNCMANRAGIASLANEAYAEKTRAAVGRFRGSLMAELRRCRGLTVFEGAANFVLVRLDTPYLNVDAIRVRLLSEGIAVRACSNFEGLDQRYFRVAVRTPGENRRLGKALRLVLED